ncbi:uncharacterized protein EAF02_005084 [Botrytis sinoallii]|uniref:uncharacterized protein n=1 Tax=Botrytis sinoallii TaxID=1463999 RepID=UPI0018FFEA9E|nr:uncharacterized protein EAF02_005084 [Botrytis sinoallii]KAF7884748.1 hypothetical protein EAF02_005084 [Botrytis sinoallii]
MSSSSALEGSNKTAVKSEARLTFGIEIEYLLATVHPVHPAPHSKDTREKDGKKLDGMDKANENIGERLKAKGIPVTTTVWETDTSPSDAELRTKWHLKSDSSVTPKERIHPNYREFGMEISSPPYYYDQASRELIPVVLETLRNNYLVRVNGSAGFHVHVGNEYDGFSFPVFRNLVAILYTYERQIRLMVSAERAQTSQTFCRSFTWCTFATSAPDITRLEFLNHILSYQNQDDWKQFWTDMTAGVGARLAFNLVNLKLPYQSEKRTIEFRLHPGTLDPEVMLHWIHFCIKVTEKACLIKDENELYKLLRRDVEKPIGTTGEDCSTVDFLMWLGCPAQAYYYGAPLVADQQGLKDRIQEDERMEQVSRALAVLKRKEWEERRRRAQHARDFPGDDADFSEVESG